MTILQPRLIRTPLAAVEWVGRQTAQFGNEVGYASALLFESMYWLMLGHWRNQPVRISAVFKEAVEVGVRAIPIVCIACFATGTMLAMQGIHTLRQFGADSQVVVGIAYSVSREFAPLITGIFVAGRTGSAVAARIGTMTVSQEIDALRVTDCIDVHHALPDRAGESGGDAGWRVVLPRRAGYAGRGIL